MRKFTKLWQWMMILLISSSVLVAQAQKDVSSGKAKVKVEQKEEIKSQFNEEQLNFLEKNGLMEEVLVSGKELDPEVMLKMMEMSGYDKSNPFEANNNGGLIDVVGTYTFSQATGAYTEITGGTVLGNETTDDQRFVDPLIPLGGTTLTGPGFPIGFNFNFDGVVFDRIAINANGWISLGQSELTPSVNNASTSAYAPISSTTAITPDNLVSRIVAFGRDLQAQTGAELRIETIGTTPNQECVIQWKNYRKYNATGDNYNFQIRLLENGNVIKLAYGIMSNNATAATPQVGLRAAPATTATNYANRTTTTDWLATTAGGTNTATCTLSGTVYPPIGLNFIYTPPVAGTPLPPSNPNPANAALGIPTTGNLTWDFGTNTTTYDLWFGPAGSMIKYVNGGAAGASGSFSYFGLTNQTNYQWQVIAYNGALVTNGPVWIFTTACGTYTTPFTEDFNGTPFPPTCWERYSGLLADPIVLTTTTAGWIQDDWRNIVTGDKAARLNIWTTTINHWLVTPQINLGTGGKQLEFDLTLNAYGTSNPPGLTGVDDKFAIIISTDGGATWTTANILRLYDNAGSSYVYNNINPNGETVIINTTGYTGIVKFGFYGESTVSNADNDLMINNLKVRIPPSCPDPGTLGATNITGISANLTWVSLSGLSDIEFGTFGFTPTGVPTDVGKTSPYTKTGLSAQTQYSFYVRDNCGGGEYSAWVGPYSFYTACATFVAPFLEVFQNTTIPNCWTMSGPQAWLFTTTWPGYGAAGLTDHTGTGGSFAGVDGSGSASITGITLTTPLIDISALTNPALKFYLFNNNINDPSYQTLRVDLWDGAAWNNSIYFWGPTDNNPNWVEVIASLVPYTITGDIQIRFVVDKGPGSPFYDDLIIDDVSVGEGPTCPNPSMLGATNITTTQANLTWVSVSGLSDIEFGLAGFTPTGVPTDAGKTSPYTKTGLSASSSYSFYVRDNCGGGEYSDWVGPYTFFTPCGVFSLPFSESFPTASFPNCWTEQLEGLITTPHWSIQNSNLAGGAAYEARAYWSPGQGATQADNDRLVTPPLNTTGLSGIKVSFRQFLSDYSGGGNVWIKVQSSADGLTWTDEWVHDAGVGVNIPAEVKELTITNNVGGTTYIAWTLSGYTYNINNWNVDDIVISVPLAHDVAAVSVDIPSLIEPGFVNPTATVKNVGLNAETFNVNMTIGAYSNTKSVTLNPGASTQVTFDPWNAIVGNYTATVCTQLAGDLDPTNDCVSKPISVQVLRKMYGYLAYPATSGLPEGPCYFYAQDPGTIYSLGATTSDEFIGAGTWANDVWYGSEYYDATLLTGGGWWTIDPVTGTMTKLGDYDIGFAGISYNPVTDVMYGISWSGTSSDLYTIVPATGAVTLLGPVSTNLIINLASDGSNYLYGFALADDNLYRIDPALLTATAIGYSGFDFNYAQDLEWDFENNVMYAAAYNNTASAGQLMTVDLTTGACTLIGNFMGNAEITGFAIPYALGYEVSGILRYNGNPAKPLDNVTIDLMQGPIVIASTVTGVDGSFLFTNINDGSYTYAGSTTKPRGGTNVADVNLIVAHLLGSPLTGLPFLAADVNADGLISVVDYNLLVSELLGSNPVWAAPDWIFSNPAINVSGGNATVNLNALCSGDPDGSYAPPAGK